MRVLFGTARLSPSTTTGCPLPVRPCGRGLGYAAAYVRTAEVCVLVGCLALNASFEPLTMVPVRRALRLVIDGKAEIVESDPARHVHSARLSMPRPAVIRLTKFVHVPRRFRRQVTNTFLFARDRYRCQYCGRTQVELKPRESLTRDHLVPLSRGGTNDWTNVVTACSSCNTRKADHYAHEIGMQPLTRPVEPHFVHLSWAVRRLTPTQAKYIRVFYGEHTLHQVEALEARGAHGSHAAHGGHHGHHGHHGHGHQEGTAGHGSASHGHHGHHGHHGQHGSHRHHGHDPHPPAARHREL